MPDGVHGKLINSAILKRTDRYWKQYRYKLKKKYFDPSSRTINEIYADRPDGVNNQNWSELVEYWLSEDAKVCTTYFVRECYSSLFENKY